SLLICVSVRDLNLTTAVRRLFDAANALNITLAALLLLDVTAVRQFFLTHYAFGYDDLLPYMFDERKPVIMFGSHSVAGFFFYLLFYMAFQTFVMTRSKLNLVYALCYLALLASLASFTSAVFAPLAVIQIVLHFQWHKSFLAGMGATALLLTAAVALPQTGFYDNVKTDFLDVTGRADNGLMGRYSSSGGLVGNIDYIAEHPFQPIGLGLSYQLWYADSGPVEYFLKGSFPLLLTVYGGVYVFFYRNLNNKRRSLFLFLVFLAFESGYSNLQYLRTQFFLPFLMVYLNGLDRADLSRELQHV